MKVWVVIKFDPSLERFLYLFGGNWSGPRWFTVFQKYFPNVSFRHLTLNSFVFLILGVHEKLVGFVGGKFRQFIGVSCLGFQDPW